MEIDIEKIELWIEATPGLELQPWQRKLLGQWLRADALRFEGVRGKYALWDTVGLAARDDRLERGGSRVAE